MTTKQVTKRLTAAAICAAILIILAARYTSGLCAPNVIGSCECGSTVDACLRNNPPDDHNNAKRLLSTLYFARKGYLTTDSVEVFRLQTDKGVCYVAAEKGKVIGRECLPCGEGDVEAGRPCIVQAYKLVTSARKLDDVVDMLKRFGSVSVHCRGDRCYVECTVRYTMEELFRNTIDDRITAIVRVNGNGDVGFVDINYVK